MKKENSFLKAGAILVVSGFIVKVLSAAYRIPLTRMLGATQMGRYSAVINIFMPFFSFATAGIIPSVARFTAQIKDDTDSTAVYLLAKQAFGLYLPVSVVLAALFLVFGRIYAAYSGEPLFFTGALVLAVCIPAASAEMIFKGITQGRMEMIVTAKANVMESVIKTGFGIGAVFFTLNCAKDYPQNLPVVLCLASVTLSGIVCVVYLFKTVKIKSGGVCAKNTVTKKQLFSMSQPVASSALVVSLVSFFDTAVCLPVIKKLPYSGIVQSFKGASFMGAGEISVYLFGIYQGMVLTVFNLVPVVMASVGAACMPVITRAQSFRDKTYLLRQTDKLFCVTALISIPAGAYIFCFRGEIIEFLFGTTAGQTAIAAQLLAIMAPFVAVSCFTSSFNAVIQAFGKSGVIFKILLTASAVRCLLSFVLCSYSGINIKAFAVSAAAFYTIIFVMSAVYTSALGVKFNPFKIVLPPVVVSLAMAAVSQSLIAPMVCYLPLVLKLFLQGIIFCTGYMLLIYITGFTVDIWDKK